MFERFTDRARRVVVLAQEEARRLSHNYIGTEHILLGLTAEGDGVAARALLSLGVSADRARAEVVQAIGHGQSTPTGHIPFTPRAKKVLELSLREALQLGHGHIGSGHILLGVVREGEGIAAQVLAKLGADQERVRQRVVELLRTDDEAEPGPEHGPDPRAFLPRRPPGIGTTAYSAGILVGALGDPPALRDVVALGTAVPLWSGAVLTPISLTVWSTYVELRYTTTAGGGPPPAVTPEDWAVEDDLGTPYAYTAAALTANGPTLVGTICYKPAPPAQARRFSLRGPAGVRVDVDLPETAPPATAEATGPAAEPPAAEEPGGTEEPGGEDAGGEQAGQGQG
jgi:hypothetical protein